MPALPELAATKMPSGSHEAITHAAIKHGVSPSEYMRAALHRQLIHDGLCPYSLDVIAPRLRQLVPQVKATAP